ncbi:MAG: TerC family protein [Planctomycetota bacterium]|nr:TerC family protein [Planctomycetota bacterium]MEE3298595.1 TerC family protein [Planctomycetota bacterium]
MNSGEAWIALLTLTGLELILGIDNIVFISVLTGRLPEDQRKTAWRVGLLLAMGMRIALLFCLTWVLGLSASLFTVLGADISGRDLILILGGLFLLGKSTHEIHHSLEGHDKEEGKGGATASFATTLVQITLLDLVFSLDSVITAVGMVDELPVMIIAVVISVLLMIFFARGVGKFVNDRPTIKILALSFLLLIGMALVADGLEFHIPKGYIYFAMGFSLFVEVLNLKVIELKTGGGKKDQAGKGEA